MTTGLSAALSGYVSQRIRSHIPPSVVASSQRKRRHYRKRFFREGGVERVTRQLGGCLGAEILQGGSPQRLFRTLTHIAEYQ
jgi:hypothetical protein